MKELWNSAKVVLSKPGNILSAGIGFSVGVHVAGGGTHAKTPKEERQEASDACRLDTYAKISEAIKDCNDKHPLGNSDILKRKQCFEKVSIYERVLQQRCAGIQSIRQFIG